MNIKGIIFDYGGTIDTDCRHWSEVLWDGYCACGVNVTKAQFRDAYVFGERTMARIPLVRPEHNFHDVLLIKVEQEFRYLVENSFLPDVPENTKFVASVAQWCYDYVLRVLSVTRPVVRRLAQLYPLVLVSNFYGNINTILADFQLADCFSHVVESSVVGVRKPDPAIYQLGVDAIGLPADEVLVVGDSFSKDVVPAKAVGCRVAWLKGQGWGDETIDESVPDFILSELPQLLGCLGV